ncbi:MAG: hypothetical protein ACPG77_07190 [Nannocystaceae bacterium]
MEILLRSVITGFGLKLGGDIYKLFTSKLGFSSDNDDSDLLEPSKSDSERRDDEDGDGDGDDVDNELQGWHAYLGDFEAVID